MTRVRLPEFPDYEIDLEGHVVSHIGRTPRVLKPIRVGAYVGLQLRDKHGVLQKRYLHRLVAEAAYGPCPEGMHCCHTDGDRTNNHHTNLRWDTPTRNNADKVEHGTALCGAANPMARLTADDVAAMRRERQQTGISYSQIARKFNVSPMTAYRAIIGQSWAVSEECAQ